MFIRNGKLYMGQDTTVPNFARSGSTVSLDYSSGSSTLRAGVLGLGAAGKPIIINTPANPEGAYTAPPGSLALSDAGGLYIKSTGTGNTGWVAK
jgi:hypothetical protein